MKEVDNFIEALAAEVLAQETLVDKTRYDVNKVSQDHLLDLFLFSHVFCRSTWRLMLSWTRH